MSRTWDIVGKLLSLFLPDFENLFILNGKNFIINILRYAGVDLISGVSCKSPYEWVDRTASDWDFNDNGRNKETFNVSIVRVY